MSESDNRLFDKRIVERNIKKGLVTRDEYNKRLDALPDMESNAEALNPDEPAAADAADAADAAPEETTEPATAPVVDPAPAPVATEG